MKPRFGIVLILPLIVVLGGCSWMHQFILVNKSGHDLHVSYRLTEMSNEGVFDTVPRLKKGNQLDTLLHTFDPKTGVVSFRLPAGKEVVIGQAMNTSFDKYKNDPKQFNLAEIRTDGQSGRLTLPEIIRLTNGKKVGEAVLELH